MEKGNMEIELLCELEEHFRKPVFVIAYNPTIEYGITNNDEIYIEYFIERIIKKNRIRDCVIIFNGFGGDLKTALLCSAILRKNLNYYSCFVPSVIGSSLVYFALQSNKLIIGNDSILTQIDPLIEHKGEMLRAIKNLTNIDGEIRKKSHNAVNYNVDILKEILKKGKLLSGKCFSKKNEINLYELGRIVDLFMGKEFHESGLKLKDLEKLKINLRKEEDNIIKVANKIIQICRKELQDMEDYNRLVILSKEGGYFFE